MNSTLFLGCLYTLFNTRADEIAKEARFLNRSENISGSRFLQALAHTFNDKPDATYERLALPLDISRSTMFNHFNPNATNFCRAVLAEALSQTFQANRQSFPLLDRFEGIYLDDCTQLPLPDACAEEFPGCGSGVCDLGKAGMKVFTRLEVQRGAICHVSIHSAKTADCKAAEDAPPLPKKSLHLADMGFVDFAKMRERTEQGVYFISRLPTQTTLVFRKGEERQPLVKLLQKTREQGRKRIDRKDVVLGDKQKVRGRLVALACPAKVAQERLRKANEDAKRRGRTLSEEQKEMCYWTVFFCNVPKEVLSAEEVYQVYRLRWQIELLFKRFKSCGGMRQSTSEKPERVKCEWYLKLLIQIVKNWQQLVRGGPLVNVNQVLLAEIAEKYFGELVEASKQGIKQMQVVFEKMEEELQQIRERSRRRKNPTASQRFAQEAERPSPMPRN